MKTILLVEDDISLRGMLTRLLEREGYRIIEAGNGREAMQIIEYVIPDLVVTDIIMPDQDGIGTINEIIKNHPDTMIIAISGGGRMLSEDYLQIAEMLGARYTFTKPFSNKDFLEKVKELLEE